MLTHHPELAERIHAVVAVAGRYEGQRFTTGTTNGRSHRDFNFEKDSDAFRVLLDAKVELVLAPFEISRKVWVKQPYLQQLTGSRAARLIEPAGVWLQFWTDTFAVDGFNPFDTLAIAWLTRRDLITCDRRLANIEVLPDDRTEAAMQGTDVTHKPYLLVRQASEGNAGSTVTWCHDVQSEAFLEDLRVRLTR